MGHGHSSSSNGSSLVTSGHEEKTKEKVEKLFRQNNRTNRSRSLDNRTQEKLPNRPVGSSHSARFPKTRHIPVPTQGPRKSEDGPNGSISGLTRDDKRIIETCWFKCSQKQLRKSSCDMFWDILHTDEDILRLFRLDHVSPNRLKDNEYFKSHASNLALVLNLVVTNLQDNFEQAQDALQALGYQHLHLIDRTHFQSMYWDIFTDCFERNPPPSFRKGAEREVWSRMILFIMGQMKTGYQRAIQEEKCERLSVPLLM
uniref:GLOBIN domain-containing protein n=1 Tax=Caenorhabditis tropicalis TaxID=1561998 RepID=A0A1I7TYQ0_9PELO